MCSLNSVVQNIIIKGCFGVYDIQWVKHCSHLYLNYNLHRTPGIVENKCILDVDWLNTF